MKSFAKNTTVMTAVNLIMKTVSVCFNAYLTSKAGSEGMGLFQLVMTVYSFARTVSGGGVKLSSTRAVVRAKENAAENETKTFAKLTSYALFCGTSMGIILFFFSGFIGTNVLSNDNSVPMLKILAFSLPFSSINEAFSGYFTAKDLITSHSLIILIEQIIKICITVFLFGSFPSGSTSFFGISMVIGITVSEMISFLLSKSMKYIFSVKSDEGKAVPLKEILRIALPDASGAAARSILLSAEHLLIPECLQKSGISESQTLSVYGNIHGIALPAVLYPCAVLNSISALIIPELAKLNERNDKKTIEMTVEKSIRNTVIYSVVSAVFCALSAPAISKLIYKTDEAVGYIRILSPLIPVMYTDTVTDGILKGLDQQAYSMIYNLIDSALCVILVIILLPKYSVKGYIFILYLSEIINFYLSFGRLVSVCKIRIFKSLKEFSKHSSMCAEQRQYQGVHGECVSR